MPDLSDAAARELYALPPDDFMARRGELVDAARKNGDAETAQAIGKLRKPTVGAWLVNALVLDDPGIVDTLTDLGARLRAAQEALDAAKLRELSGKRRTLVDTLTTKAFRRAERRDPPAALRDEVTGTFDAAIADAEVAARLGRLPRAEQWSGFGFLPTGAAPQLSVVRGAAPESAKRAKAAKTAKTAETAKAETAKPSKSAETAETAETAKSAEPAETAEAEPAKPRRSAAEKRRAQRALASAQDAFGKADAAFTDAQGSERELDQQLRRLVRQLARLQERVDAARADLERARKDATSARAKRREARSALDRAEREAAD